MKRLELDLDRASWFVELALEFKERTGESLPNDFVAVLSKGLFDSEQKGEVVRHPSDDAVAAVLSAASETSIKLPNGTEVKLNPKGIKTIQKYLDEAR